MGTQVTLFRSLLAAMLIAVSIYTALVIAQHGWNLFPIFFGDIAAMTWPGQFNVDFTGFLILSALWTAWRNHFSPLGLALAAVAFVGGMMFLTIYLLVVSGQTKGDIRAVLLGPRRAGA